MDVRMLPLIAGLAAAMALAGCGGAGSDTGGGTAPTTAAPATTAGTTGARTYRGTEGNVPAGTPDLTAVRISDDFTTVHLVFRFGSAPPLRTSTSGGWTDMLLMGIDVPPIGPGPTPSGWTGLDYALGMHGVDDRAVFRAMSPVPGVDAPPQRETLRSTVSGREIRIDLPRRLIGNPTYFAFNVAVGREGGAETSSAGGDSIPATGTARYTLSPG